MAFKFYSDTDVSEEFTTNFYAKQFPCVPLEINSYPVLKFLLKAKVHKAMSDMWER